MKLSLGFSPCPNDTFIFDALVNNKIDTEGLVFDVYLEDVQTLNQWAKEKKLDVSKISYGVLPLIVDDYVTLNSGGALGKSVGPLLITSSTTNCQLSAVNSKTIAIPGENTTAHMLFSLAFPEAKNKQFLVFHDIEAAVLSGKVDAGVIIHENRFTYQDKGLVKLMDLGDYWEQKLKVPIALGGIVAKRQLGKTLAKKVDVLIRKSVEFAFLNYSELTDYTKQHSQEMSEAVMRQHIDLYVNNYSINLGEEGKKAVLAMLNVYQQIHPETSFNIDNIFL
ncbi:MAG: 1,4-dihydroxy-6-naphthoate synthase [Deinococcales bacterium]|nr:1,4-dihydroxy-6-naphthoate synthase [Chitinophagaceae bacterium]